MPLASRPRRVGGGGEQEEKVNTLLATLCSQQEQGDGSQEKEQEEQEQGPMIDQSDLWLVKYDELAQKSRNIPLSHLSCCREGGELFSRLCMWVDINQKYVELGLFPQWDDIARELNIDQMKTEWVKVCVRPEQSFTRAILEIYMQDGGTLGEVIAALRKQKQYRIIQEISDLAEEFLDVYNTYHKTNLMSAENGTAPSSGHLYSILKTLFETFNKSGQEDPLNKFQLYSGGFKQYMRSLAPGPTTDTMGPPNSDIIVNAVHFNQQGKNGTTSARSEDSGYTSPHRYAGSLPSMTETSLEQSSPISEITKIRKTHKVLIQDEDDLKPRHTIRILLVFAKDGAVSAEEIVTGMINFQIDDYPNIRVDFFRLNELELWQALILNPEGCLMKWLDEMDFVMPLLTPEYLQDLHDSNIPVGPPAPTSAMINKYIYTILRSEYVARGCQNTKVRAAIPGQFIEQLYRCKPVQAEPLFKMWKEADLATTKERVTAIVKVWAKKHEL